MGGDVVFVLHACCLNGLYSTTHVDEKCKVQRERERDVWYLFPTIVDDDDGESVFAFLFIYVSLSSFLPFSLSFFHCGWIRNEVDEG